MRQTIPPKKLPEMVTRSTQGLRQRRRKTPFLQSGSRISNYEIIKELGRGGMGVVYLARDLDLARLVAIKFMLSARAEASERFITEARATARCQHENIVIIHEVDTFDGFPFMVLEYLPGQSLREFLHQGPPLAPGRAVELIVPVLRALVCAHAHDIVHRDLKPANVLITDNGIVKVLDFGIAKLISVVNHVEPHGDGGGAELVDTVEELTGAGVRVGTPRYMSPEQVRGDYIDHRSDIWSVGIMLWEMILGGHPLTPFEYRKFQDIAHTDTPMPSMRALAPDIGPLASIIDRCLIKNVQDRTDSAQSLLAEIESLTSGPSLTMAEAQAPFAGLSTLQEADGARFFGRERDTAAAIERLRNTCVLAITGPSGAGKSSLVRAGMIPALRRSGEGWEVLIMRPGRHPVAALARTLGQYRWYSSSYPESYPEKNNNSMQVDEDLLMHKPGWAGAKLRAWAGHRQRRVLLFIDQFEELYTLVTDGNERAAFLRCLEGVADDPSSPLRVVISVRSDYLDRLAGGRGLLAAATQGLMFLPPLDREGLRNALIRPIMNVGYCFESSQMVEDILDELQQTRTPLPLMQFAAAQLWEERDRGRQMLTHRSYRDMGGTAGALARHADMVLAGMTAAEMHHARAMFLRLVTAEWTRAPASMRELRELAQVGPHRHGRWGSRAETQHKARGEEVLARLIEGRLLVVEGGNGDSSSDDGMVEIVHESLIARWPTLARWLSANEGEQAFTARLRSAALEWEKSARREGLLWRGQAAEEASRYYRRHLEQPIVGLGGRELDYLAAVATLANGIRRRRRQLVFAALLTLSAFAMALAYLVVRAESEADRAQQQARAARNATRMATAREQLRDPTRALAILREIEAPDVPRGWGALAQRLIASPIARVVFPHSGEVNTIDVSPDGSCVATGSTDGKIRIWSTDGLAEPLVLSAHDGAIWSVRFSPDGSHLVSASEDRTIRLHATDGHGPSVRLSSHDQSVFLAIFSPDGGYIASTSGDKTVRLWDVEGRGPPRVLGMYPQLVSALAFSPDGSRLSAASADGTVRTVQIHGETAAAEFSTGHSALITKIDYSPDGKYLLSASHDKTMRLQPVDGSGKVIVFRGHEAEVNSAVFSPDGRHIVSSSSDGTVRLWNASGRGTAKIIGTHKSMVWQAVYSSDGNYIASASADRTARLWELSSRGDTPLVLHGHEHAVWSVDYHPNGKQIVSSSYDGTVRVWNADGSGEPTTIGRHKGQVLSVRYSPDGSQIMSGGSDGMVRLWNAGKRGRAKIVNRHKGSVWWVGFSPDGTMLASAAEDGTMYVRSTVGDNRDNVLINHDRSVVSAAFSPDGARVASASQDGKVRIWRINQLQDAPIILEHGEVPWWVTFSPDGRHVATAGNDHIVRIWDADGRGTPRQLKGHDNSVNTVAFSPEGGRLVSTSADSSIRVWSLDAEGDVLVLPGHSGSVISARFSPDGNHIASVSRDQTIRIWSDFIPLRADDARLWSRTNYCLPVRERLLLLSVSEDLADIHLRACKRRVHAAYQSNDFARLSFEHNRMSVE